MSTERISTSGKSSSNGALAAALSALGSVLAATTCCLPVLPFVLAAGTASTATFLSTYIECSSAIPFGGFRSLHRSRVLSGRKYYGPSAVFTGFPAARQTVYDLFGYRGGGDFR